MCSQVHGFTWWTMVEAHHIWPKALYPTKAYDPDNGITLCRRCHRKVVHHNWHGQSWRKFVVLWATSYMRRKAIRQWGRDWRTGRITIRQLRKQRKAA